MTELSVIFSILAFLSGVLAGAFFTSRIAARRYRNELTLKIIGKTPSQIEDIERALEILHFETDKSGNIQDKNSGSSKTPKKGVRKEKFDKVIKVGNYLDEVAYLYLTGKLNKRLFIHTNIPDIIDTFIYLLKDFKLSRYNLRAKDPASVYISMLWTEGWKYLLAYKERKTFRWRCFLENFIY